MKKRYDACAQAFGDLLEKGHTRDGKRLTIAWLAKKSKVPEPTLRACKAGTRYLSDDSATKVVDSLGGLTARDKEDFLVRTREGSKVVAREPGLTKRLASKDASLSVEGLPYLPFSNGKDQFVDQFLDRFFRLSGIEKKPVTESPQLEDRIARLLKHESDIAVNLFCTLPRLKLLDFLLFPVRLSISAVIPSRFRSKRAEVRARLLGKQSGSVRLKLVVTAGEVGHQHATNVCGFSDDEMLVLEQWKLDDFVTAFTNLDAQYHEQDSVIPVLFCDEVISLLVLQKLNERRVGERYVLAFPLTTKFNIRRFDARRETPEYRLGLAIDRGYKELKEYLSESLQFYLLTDPEYLARLYATLFAQLQTYVGEAIASQEPRALEQESSSRDEPARQRREREEIIRYRLARDFARYALRLDREEIDRYRDRFLPWQHIMRRAYQIVCTSQARDRQRIRKNVEAILSERLGRDFKQSKIPKDSLSFIKGPLQEEFDVPLDLAEHAAPKTLEGYVSAVQTALLASAAGSAQFDVDFPVIVAQAEHRRHVLELFSEYEKELISGGTQVDPLPDASSIDAILAPLPTGQKPSGVILLAVVHGQYIGCVQIAAVNSATRSELLPVPDSDGSIRLTRLYVRPGSWRGGGASAALVWKAIEYAAEGLEGKKVVINENDPKLLAIFRKQGFEPDPDDPNHEQLQYPLEEPASPRYGNRL